MRLDGKAEPSRSKELLWRSGGAFTAGAAQASGSGGDGLVKLRGHTRFNSLFRCSQSSGSSGGTRREADRPGCASPDTVAFREAGVLAEGSAQRVIQTRVVATRARLPRELPCVLNDRQRNVRMHVICSGQSATHHLAPAGSCFLHCSNAKLAASTAFGSAARTN